jgi:hypothetical protein
MCFSVPLFREPLTSATVTKLATNLVLHITYETGQRFLLGASDEYFTSVPCCTLAQVRKFAACHDSATVYMNIIVDSCKSRLGILFI